MKTQALQYDNGKYYYIEGGSTIDFPGYHCTGEIKQYAILSEVKE